MLRNVIENYINHIQEFDSLNKFLETISVADLLFTLSEMLKSKDKEQISSANLFIRDMVNFSRYIHKNFQNFREQLLSSELTGLLYSNIFAPMFSVRDSTVYTLGKIGDVNSIPVLENAFTYFLDTDPLLLSRVFFELSWLGGYKPEWSGRPDLWSLVDQMVNSPNKMTRWAILSISDFDSSSVFRYKDNPAFFLLQTHYLNLLIADDFNLLKEEAVFRLQEINLERNVNNLNKKERNRARKTLLSNAPAVTFDMVELRFISYIMSIKTIPSPKMRGEKKQGNQVK